MRTKLLQYWENARTSYWFVPSLMAAAAVLAAILLLDLDRRVPGPAGSDSWLYTGSAEGARSLLSTIAGSAITVAGVVFSVVIVALTLASSQFGPRLLRNFMRDLGNQITLGTFIATDLYCFLVLRTVRGETEAGGAFVPQASVTGAVVLALASLGVLIYFIHHAAASIQAENVIRAVADDLWDAIDEMFPREIGEAAGPEEVRDLAAALPQEFDRLAVPVLARKDGYVQIVDPDLLLHAATKHDVVIRLAYRPGQYVIRGLPLVLVYPPQRLNDDLAEAVHDAYALGAQRTTQQDLEFAVDQLVEVAVRALSPAVNDPFTAMTCVDVLAASLCRLARRRIPSPFRADGDGRLRVIVRVNEFGSVVDAAFNQIRQYGRESVSVTIRLPEALASVARSARTEEQRAALLRHARMIHCQANAIFRERLDLKDVEERYQHLLALLSAAGPPAGDGDRLPEVDRPLVQAAADDRPPDRDAG